MDYKKVASTKDITEGEMKLFDIEGKQITIAGVKGDYFAFNDRCPHMNAPLHMGSLDGEVITCPLHKATYDVTTGKKLSDPKIPIPKFVKMGKMMADISVSDLEVYQVKIEDGTILVEL